MGFKGAVLIFNHISFHPTFLPLKKPHFFPLTHTHPILFLPPPHTH